MKKAIIAVSLANALERVLIEQRDPILHQLQIAREAIERAAKLLAGRRR